MQCGGVKKWRLYVFMAHSISQLINHSILIVSLPRFVAACIATRKGNPVQTRSSPAAVNLADGRFKHSLPLSFRMGRRTARR